MIAKRGVVREYVRFRGRFTHDCKCGNYDRFKLSIQTGVIEIAGDDWVSALVRPALVRYVIVPAVTEE